MGAGIQEKDSWGRVLDTAAAFTAKPRPVSCVGFPAGTLTVKNRAELYKDHKLGL